MTGPERYRLAEEPLTDRGVLDNVLVGAAQAHATLALAAATAMALRFRQPNPEAHAFDEPMKAAAALDDLASGEVLARCGIATVRTPGSRRSRSTAGWP